MDPPQSTLPEHRVISWLFIGVIETQRQMDPPSTLPEHRAISWLFIGVIETQRQMDIYTAKSREGNFTFLLTSSGQQWQFYIATDF